MAINIEDYVQNRNAQLAYLVELDRKHYAEVYASHVASYNRFIVEEGKDPGYPPPTVPLGPTVTPPDPVTGMVSIVEGAAPVCAPLFIMAVPDLNAAPPDIPLIGKRMWPGAPYFQAMQQDAVPSGQRVEGVSADGVRGTFEKLGNPVSGGGGGTGGQGAVHGVYLLLPPKPGA